MIDARSRLVLIGLAQRLAGFLPEDWDRRTREIGKVALNYGGARRTGSRSVLFALLKRGSPGLVAPFGSGRLLVDSDDEVIGRGVFVTGGFERRYMETAMGFLRSNGLPSGEGLTFVDVGANIGTSTVDALLHFGFARAVCFEPDRHNFRLLRANLSLNDLDSRAVTHCLALSCTDGQAVLERSARNFGDHRIVPGAVPSQNGSSTREIVDCVTLDSLVERGEIPVASMGMVWIDAQGHEGYVLEGARTVMDSGVPVVVEYSPEALGDRLTSFEELVGDAYRTVVDLRRLAAGVIEGSIFSARQMDRLRRRYSVRHLTDLLLLH